MLMVWVPADAKVPATRIGVEVLLTLKKSSTRTNDRRAQSQRAGHDLRGGRSDTKTRAVGESDGAGACHRALEHQRAGVDGGRSTVSVRASNGERARSSQGERAAAAGQAGGEHRELSVESKVVLLASRRAEHRGVIGEIERSELQGATVKFNGVLFAERTSASGLGGVGNDRPSIEHQVASKGIRAGKRERPSIHLDLTSADYSAGQGLRLPRRIKLENSTAVVGDGLGVNEEVRSCEN